MRSATVQRLIPSLMTLIEIFEHLQVIIFLNLLRALESFSSLVSRLGRIYSGYSKELLLLRYSEVSIPRERCRVRSWSKLDGSLVTSSRPISIVVEAVVMILKCSVCSLRNRTRIVGRIENSLLDKGKELRSSPKPSPASVEDFPYQATGQTTLVFLKE